MESENETRPLLHTFQNETWRSRARKRCFRFPSQITITGTILGLFLVVVTLIILFENLQTTKKDELQIDEALLASPFKYNKKAQDKSWQNKKDFVKTKIKDQDRNWDKTNNGLKVVPDPLGGKRPFNVLQSTKYGKDHEIGEDYKDLNENQKEKLSKLTITSDEYGKEIDDSLEVFPELELSDVNAMKDFSLDDSGIKSMLLTSKVNWKEVDEGWRELSEQGWKDKDIRIALFKALKERNETKKEEPLQSPVNYDQFWKGINDSWKKHIHQGDDEIEKQKNINDEWKNKMNKKEGDQSGFSEGWKDKVNRKAEKQKLIKEGWRDKVNRKSEKQKLIKDGWRDKVNRKAEKQKIINDGWRDKMKNKEEEQEDINNERVNKMNLLESPTASDKKWKKVDEGWKTLSKGGLKNKDIEEALINAWKERITPLQSPMNLQDLWGKATSMLKNLLQEGMDKEDSQKSINGEWAKKMNILQSPEAPNNPNNEKNYDFSNILSEHGFKNGKNAGNDEALLKVWKEKEKTLQSPDDLIDFVSEVIKTIKDLQEERSKKDTSENEKENISPIQSSMSLENVKWKNVDDGWKKLTDQGWKDKDLQEAVYRAWKDNDKLLQSAMGHSNMKWKKVDDGWKTIHNKSVGLPTRCPFKHRPLSLSAPMPESRIDCALITEEVRKKFGRCIDLSFLPKECKPSWRVKCFSSYKYRKIDGTCNNKMHPTWGKSRTPFVRMLAPDYADGVSAIRTAKSGDPLPNTRYLSTKLYSTKRSPDTDVSVLFLYFGLLVDHDLADTNLNLSPIPCCDEDFRKNPENRPKECLQIDVSSDDPFYGPRNVTCLNLVRSIPVNGECAGRREQLNRATSFLDASAVYGPEIKHNKQLRTFSRGQLRTQFINNAPYMSFAEGGGRSCGTLDEPIKCFEAGDSRANMIVELASMHTLWYREHNRIAMELHKLNPQWTDETLFQEARKILIGELQHIVFNEYLPILLGKEAIKKYDLELDESEIYDGYDDTVDPSVFNVFGSAAFRFGHSIVPDMQILVSSNNSILKSVPLHDIFFNNEFIFHNGFDDLLRGAASQKTQAVDSYISQELRDHLFQNANLNYGHDLASVGIQRGRDHGLPAYVKWRSVCGLSEIKNWDDLYAVMDEDRADMLKSVYQSVEDIDLIPGALAERHDEGSHLGPTHLCLIARQFRKIRKGDRFWFEIQNEITSFTKGQLDQIYKSNIARIVCDNSNDIKEIQKLPFIIPSAKNPLIDCDGIPKVDLREWRLTY